MAHKPNGSAGPHLYMPPTEFDFDSPAAPGEPDALLPQAGHSAGVFATRGNGGNGGNAGVFAGPTIGEGDQVLALQAGEGDRVLGPESTQMSPGVDFGPSQVPLGPEPLPAGPTPPPLPGQYLRGMPPPGHPLFTQAVGYIPQEQAHMLGMSAIAVSMGVAAGTYYGGMYGGVAGGLLAGSALNAYRAFHYYKQGSDEDDREARVSGTYAVAGGAIAAVLWTKLASKSERAVRMKSNRPVEADFDDDHVVVANPCNIRPAGP